mmetsp:Transcript_22209/g.29318  ORF Transcript_22209/g.29318 Transcript_22209/m.29318 type:complete len:81 (-) Transcript_22209:983-1225(-)
MVSINNTDDIESHHNLNKSGLAIISITSRTEEQELVDNDDDEGDDVCCLVVQDKGGRNGITVDRRKEDGLVCTALTLFGE